MHTRAYDGALRVWPWTRDCYQDSIQILSEIGVFCVPMEGTAITATVARGVVCRVEVFW